MEDTSKVDTSQKEVLDLVMTFDVVVKFIKDYGESSFWRLPPAIFMPLIIAEIVDTRKDIDFDRFLYVMETIYDQGHLRNPGRR